jgi:hypothetical protein
MTGGQIDDAPATKEPSDSPRHLPCLVQLLSRETAGAAYPARDVMKQRVARKAIEIADRQSRLCRGGEHPVIMQDLDSGSGRWLQNYYKLSERALISSQGYGSQDR